MPSSYSSNLMGLGLKKELGLRESTFKNEWVFIVDADEVLRCIRRRRNITTNARKRQQDIGLIAVSCSWVSDSILY